MTAASAWVTLLAQLWPLLAAAAGLGLYLASPHQRLRRPAPGLAARRALALVSSLGLLGSMGGAGLLWGLWPGVFAALSAGMAALTLLPALDQGLRAPTAGPGPGPAARSGGRSVT